METINIIFSSDDRYAQHLGVTLCSIFENKKSVYLIDIYVVDGGISEFNKNKLRTLEIKYNFKILYLRINKEDFLNFPISGHLSIATYYRILIPELLPNLEKILYLDCDLIAMGNIFELYNINVDNYFFAAVDEEEPYWDRYEKLKIPKDEKYFNAGVMLINLCKWRENNTTDSIMEYIKNNKEKLEAFDQDAINANLWGKWLNIDIKYNYTTGLMNIHNIDNIILIHYTGLKPWNILCEHKLKNKYFYYLKKTPWRNKKYIDVDFEKIIKKILNIIKKIIKKIGLFNIVKKVYLFIK